MFVAPLVTVIYETFNFPQWKINTYSICWKRLKYAKDAGKPNVKDLEDLSKGFFFSVWKVLG